MNSDYNFGKLVVFCICFVVASFGGCTAITNQQDNDAIQALVAKGASPIGALCSIRPGNAKEGMCTRSRRSAVRSCRSDRSP